MNKLLCLGVHLAALGFVELTTSGVNDFIELHGTVCGFPRCVIPLTGIDIGRREHPVFSGTTTPVAGTPGLLVPNV